MTIKTFTYTKNTEDISQRTVVVLQEPTNMMQAIDLSALDDEEQAMFAVELGRLKDAFKEELLALQYKYDAVHNYRQFDPLKMTNVETHY